MLLAPMFFISLKTLDGLRIGKSLPNNIFSAPIIFIEISNISLKLSKFVQCKCSNMRSNYKLDIILFLKFYLNFQKYFTCWPRLNLNYFV